MKTSNGVEIIPAIMPKNFEELRDKVSLVRGIAKTVQIDIMDGIFVPVRNWPYIDEGELEFERFINGAGELPFKEEVQYEADLMIAHPEASLSSWIEAGFGRVIPHVESVENIGEILRISGHEAPRADRDPLTMATELGIAINTLTPLEVLEEWMPYVDFVQCMGIARIGYQGEPFDGRVLERIHTLREEHPELIISVDGGVSLETVPDLVKAGANRLVVGSAVFDSDNPKESYLAIRNAANL